MHASYCGATTPIAGRRAGRRRRRRLVPERLVKYVPAETLAFFVPVAALLGDDHRPWLIVALVVGVAGTVGYLWQTAPTEPDERPRIHYYVLACLAFLSADRSYVKPLG